MIRQPDKKNRNVNEFFYAGEAKRISMMNQILGDIELSTEEERTLIWLAGWDDSTVRNVVSAFAKAGKGKQRRL